MRFLLFFAALAALLGITKTMACQNANCGPGAQRAQIECNNVGCVRSSSNSLDKLAKTAERTLSVTRVTERSNAPELCSTGNCLSAPTPTRLLENCGRSDCATPEPMVSPAPSNQAPNIYASALITDEFAVMANRPIRLPAAVTWVASVERWGLGGLYKP